MGSVRTDVELAMTEYYERRDRWVDQFGSDRLKLAKKLGLLAESDNVYREERRNREKAGWLLPNEMPAGFKVTAIHNPSLEALRALEEALELGGDSEITLAFVQYKLEVASPTDWTGQKRYVSRGREALHARFIGTSVYRWVGAEMGRG